MIKQASLIIILISITSIASATTPARTNGFARTGSIRTGAPAQVKTPTTVSTARIATMDNNGTTTKPNTAYTNNAIESRLNELQTAIDAERDDAARKDEVYTKTEIDELLQNASATNDAIESRMDELETAFVTGTAPDMTNVLSRIDELQNAFETEQGVTAKKSEVYTKTEVDSMISSTGTAPDMTNVLSRIDELQNAIELESNAAARKSDVYTKAEIDQLLKEPYFHPMATNTDIYNLVEFHKWRTNATDEEKDTFTRRYCNLYNQELGCKRIDTGNANLLSIRILKQGYTYASGYQTPLGTFATYYSNWRSTPNDCASSYEGSSPYCYVTNIIDLNPADNDYIPRYRIITFTPTQPLSEQPEHYNFSN